MMLTVIVIGELAEEDNFKSKIDYRIRFEAQRFLDRYEADPSKQGLYERRKKRRDERSQPFWDSGHKMGPSVVIKDDQGKLILGTFNLPNSLLEKYFAANIFNSFGLILRLKYHLIKFLFAFFSSIFI